ncbi:TadE family protein [Arthrobacter sp. NEB 688]|uniref:TadE family protein n=1 Tax=Arthrobacter sp. NEB 688 TaxID=904039 RepID=UPI00257079E4|nr:TadE family protein [Arthrobacter sp. NEB 688]
MSGTPRAERGAAVVDFVLVSVLLTAIFLALVQLGLVLHVRNTLISCASEGARAGARADALPGEAEARTRSLVGASLSERYARSVRARESTVSGVRVVEVEVVAPLPVLGLLGPEGRLGVVGRAFREDQ